MARFRTLRDLPRIYILNNHERIMKDTGYKKWMIYVIATIAAMGGLLFGFDTGVISGAIPFFQADFNIDDGQVEIVTSAGLIGAILGALCCGKLTDRAGRRKVILLAAIIFAIGALWSGFAPDFSHLVTARLFLGIAIGISSFAVPLGLLSLRSLFRGRVITFLLAANVLCRGNPRPYPVCRDAVGSSLPEMADVYR